MSRFKKYMVAATVVCFVPVASAVDDPAEERHERMVQVGDAIAPMGEMLKGERDFDAAVVMANLMTMQEATTGIDELFPEGSYVEGEKHATMAVWTNRADFDQKLADFNVALDAAIEAEPQSLAELGAVVSKLGDTCKACHEDYRSPGD